MRGPQVLDFGNTCSDSYRDVFHDHTWDFPETFTNGIHLPTQRKDAPNLEPFYALVHLQINISTAMRAEHARPHGLSQLLSSTVPLQVPDSCSALTFSFSCALV